MLYAISRNQSAAVFWPEMVDGSTPIRAVILLNRTPKPPWPSLIRVAKCLFPNSYFRTGVLPLQQIVVGTV